MGAGDKERGDERPEEFGKDENARFDVVGEGEAGLEGQRDELVDIDVTIDD